MDRRPPSMAGTHLGHVSSSSKANILPQQAKRFNVICCGRRWGKTVLGMDRLIQAALQRKPVAWFSPTNKLMADTWRALRSTLASFCRETHKWLIQNGLRWHSVSGPPRLPSPLGCGPRPRSCAQSAGSAGRGGALIAAIGRFDALLALGS